MTVSYVFVLYVCIDFISDPGNHKTYYKIHFDLCYNKMRELKKFGTEAVEDSTEAFSHTLGTTGTVRVTISINKLRTIRATEDR